MVLIGSILLTIAFSTLAILWFLTKTRRKYKKDNIPPFPEKPWPFFGHFFMLRGNFRDKFKIWRQKAGDIYSLDIGGQLIITVNDYDTIKEVWVKHADQIVNVQSSFINEILGEYDKGIIAGRDANWKEQRATSFSILRSFGMGKNIMAEKIQEEVDYILEKLAALKGQTEDIRMLLNISISNIICAVAVGKRFEHEDPYFVRFMIALRDTVKYLRGVGLLTAFKYLYYLPGDVFDVKKWIKATLYINEMFSKWHIKELSKTFNENEEPQNFVSAYIKEMKEMQKNGLKSNLNEANLISIITTLFFAGTDTTSTTILWFFLYMLHHPDVHEKVYCEIEAKVGNERTPNMADKPNLTYLNATIMETQRMASLITFSFPREVSADIKIRGFTFPKGSVLWAILDSVHYDKKIWGDPENFRPERFIDKNGALINREEHIPFGIGKRICVGEALARMELFLFISAIVQRFKIEPADKSGELPSLKEVFGTVNVPQPFELRFVERK